MAAAGTVAECLVQVHDYGADALIDDGPHDYLVMEYVEGTSLASRIKAAGRLGSAETLSIVAQAADALHIAHQAGIVHRDVKPGNLMVRPDRTIVLVDFGVARSIDAAVTNANLVVGSPQYVMGSPQYVMGSPQYVMGSPQYMAPEQVTNPRISVSTARR